MSQVSGDRVNMIVVLLLLSAAVHCQDVTDVTDVTDSDATDVTDVTDVADATDVTEVRDTDEYNEQSSEDQEVEEYPQSCSPSDHAHTRKSGVRCEAFLVNCTGGCIAEVKISNCKTGDTEVK